jgi:hypothetical protein
MIAGNYREQFSVNALPPDFPPNPFLANLRFADNSGPVSHGDYDEDATYTYREFFGQVD